LLRTLLPGKIFTHGIFLYLLPASFVGIEQDRPFDSNDALFFAVMINSSRIAPSFLND
jgi:hypothetical protein